jgi:hypothetical protein
LAIGTDGKTLAYVDPSHAAASGFGLWAQQPPQDVWVMAIDGANVDGHVY